MAKSTSTEGTALRKRLAAEERSMMAQFEGIVGDHRGERGRRGEEIIRGFLRRYLPHRFGVGEGEVLGPNEEFSPQLDAILFNWTGAAPLDRSPASQVYQLKDVYAGIEVRTELRPGDMAEIAERCKAFTSLIPPAMFKPTRKVIARGEFVIEREFRSLPFYGVVAHRSGDLVEIAKAYGEAIGPTPDPTTRIGFIYVMEKGFICFQSENKRMRIGPHYSHLAPIFGVFPAETLNVPPLYLLYCGLLNELESQTLDRG